MTRKQSSVILLSALGFACVTPALYAAAPATPVIDTSSLAVTIPDLKPGFTFDFAVLALRPAASNLNYVIYNRAGAPAQTPIWSEQEIRPAYSFAYELGLGYLFPAGKTINLDWTHLNSTTTTSVAAPNSAYFLGPDYEIGPDGTTIRNATGKAEFNYDVVNLDFGQLVDFGRHVEARFFIGLSNANLREQVTSTYSGNVPPAAATPVVHAGFFNTQQQVDANFFGIGPRAGFDLSYNADNGLSFLGEAAFSALIGSASAKTGYLSSSQTILDLYNQTSNYQTITDQNFVQVVPGLDAKVGINYNHTYQKGVLLTVGLGYQAAVYFNAINQYLPGSLVKGDVAEEDIQTGGIFVATMNHTLSNYSVQGPFLKATLKF